MTEKSHKDGRVFIIKINYNQPLRIFPAQSYDLFFNKQHSWRLIFNEFRVFGQNLI